MIEQHNTFSFCNGYQINPKICQNILYSHCFMSQNTCFSFLNSGTAHHFLFLPKEQHTTFSFCQNHGWSILNQSFALFMIGKNQWLIGYQISLIVIARQPKYHRFYALIETALSCRVGGIFVDRFVSDSKMCFQPHRSFFYPEVAIILAVTAL